MFIQRIGYILSILYRGVSFHIRIVRQQFLHHVDDPIGSGEVVFYHRGLAPGST